MKAKILFGVLLAVALILPLATAFNCTALHGEDRKVCKYVEDTDWSHSERDEIIQELVDSGDASLNGNFESILDSQEKNPIQLNKVEEDSLKINEENKKFLFDFSSISFLGYAFYSFAKKYYLLLKFL